MILKFRFQKNYVTTYRVDRPVEATHFLPRAGDMVEYHNHHGTVTKVEFCFLCGEEPKIYIVIEE